MAFSLAPPVGQLNTAQCSLKRLAAIFAAAASAFLASFAIRSRTYIHESVI